MTYTQNKSKKILKNKNICTIYFLFRQLSLSLSSNFLFGQCHCKQSDNFFFPFISAMLLPQIFFPFYFGNATNQLQQFFFPSYFDNAIATFFFFFGEMICAHHFFNIFTTNLKWQVVTNCYYWIKKVILVLNSNLN